MKLAIFTQHYENYGAHDWSESRLHVGMHFMQPQLHRQPQRIAVVELRWEGGRWVATRTIFNDEYGYMRQEIASKTESYDMLPNGERENYRARYTLRDGRVVTADELDQILNVSG